MAELPAKELELAPEPDSGLAVGVRELWENGQLFDFTIKTEKKTFGVHKVVAAGTSGYFKGLLTTGMMESIKGEVEVGVITDVAIQELIKFMYTSQMDLNPDNDVDVLVAACYLQMPKAVTKITKYMIENLTAENCFDVRALFMTQCLLDDAVKVRDFVKENIVSVVRKCGMKTMSCLDLQLLVQNWPDLPEWDLFVLIKTWLETDYTKRKIIIGELMPAVRFCLLNIDQLEEIKNMQLVLDSEVLQDLIIKALQYQTLPGHLRVANIHEQSRIRSAATGVCFDENLGAENESVYILHKHQWYKTQTQRLEKSEGDSTVSDVTMINDFLIIFITPSCRFYIFDPRTFSWSAIANMEIRKEKFAFVADKTHLYAIGGSFCETDTITDGVEQYDFLTNNWTSISPLPIPTKDLKACFYNGYIYVTGGCHPEERRSAKVYRLDSDNQTWTRRASMLEPRCSHSLEILNRQNRSVIYILDKDFHFEFYVESTDQWWACDYILDSEYGIPVMYDGVDYICVGNTVYYIPYHTDNNEEMGGWDITTVWKFTGKGTEIFGITVPDFAFGRKYAFCLSVGVPAAIRIQIP